MQGTWIIISTISSRTTCCLSHFASCPGLGNNLLKQCEKWEDLDLILILWTGVMQPLFLLPYITMLQILWQKSLPEVSFGSIQQPNEHQSPCLKAQPFFKASCGLCKPMHPSSPSLTPKQNRRKELDWWHFAPFWHVDLDAGQETICRCHSCTWSKRTRRKPRTGGHPATALRHHNFD